MKRIVPKLFFILTFFCINSFAQTKPGTLDPTFGTDGKVKLDFGYTNQTYGHTRTLAIQPDGKIIIGSLYYYHRNKYVKAFYRYNEDGTTDSSFGSAGAAIFFNDSMKRKILRPSSILIQPDGKILAGGNYYGQPFTARGFILTRLLANGRMDEQFGKKGELVFDDTTDNSSFRFSGIAMQRNGNILVAYSDSEHVIVRCTKRGNIDSSFGVAGKFNVDSNMYNTIAGIIVQPDNKILVLIVDRSNGANDWNFKIARLLPDGDHDLSFGDGGVQIIDFNNTQDGPNSFTLLPDGGILIAGSIWGETGLTGVAKLKSNGAIDSGFANNGKGTYSMDGLFGPIKILSASDGKFYVSGNQIGRFNYDGSWDTAFGYNGITTDHQTSTDAALQNDDKLVNLPSSYFDMRRYNAGEPITVQLKKNIAVDEGNYGTAPAEFTLVVNRPSAYDVKVNYATAGGSAVNGSDYVAAAGSSVIRAGKTSKAVRIDIIGDELKEKNEKFALVISDAVNAKLGTNDTVVCSIKNDDSGFTFSATDAVSEDLKTAGIKLYPNPAKDILRIEGLDASAKTSISVIDMKGNVILKTTTTNNNCTLNVQRLSASVYEVKIERSGDKIKTVKFVKE